MTLKVGPSLSLCIRDIITVPCITTVKRRMRSITTWEPV